MPAKISGMPGTAGTIAPARPKAISAAATIFSKISMMEFILQNRATAGLLGKARTESTVKQSGKSAPDFHAELAAGADDRMRYASCIQGVPGISPTVGCDFINCLDCARFSGGICCKQAREQIRRRLFSGHFAGCNRRGGGWISIPNVRDGGSQRSESLQHLGRCHRRRRRARHLPRDSTPSLRQPGRRGGRNSATIHERAAITTMPSARIAAPPQRLSLRELP